MGRRAKAAEAQQVRMVELNVRVRADLRDAFKQKTRRSGRTLIGAINEFLSREAGFDSPLPLPDDRSS